MRARIGFRVVITAILCNITNSSMLAQEDRGIKETALMPSAAAKQVALDIGNEYVVSLFMETLKAIDDARSDLEEIMAALREGEIKMWNNKGAWMAVLEKEKGAILKTANFSSEDMNSRVTSLRKRVWTNPEYEEEIHANGYYIQYDGDGIIKNYWTRDKHRMVRYHPGGKPRHFHFVIDDQRGFLEWDEEGRLIRMRTSIPVN